MAFFESVISSICTERARLVLVNHCQKLQWDLQIQNCFRRSNHGKTKPIVLKEYLEMPNITWPTNYKEK